MPVDLPPIVDAPVVALVALIALLMLGGSAFLAFTFFRRCVRHCRISWRDEGWGGSDHANQNLDAGKPEPPQLEAAKQVVALLPGRQPSDAPPEKSADGDAPPPPAA
jgi:hypothetical protein